MSERPVAAVVVRNAASHDARVLRCARTLRSLGYEAVVLAVTTEEEPAERAVAQGIPIVRLTPRAPLAGAARALRRLTRRLTRHPSHTPPPDVPLLDHLYGGSSSGTSHRPGASARAEAFFRPGPLTRVYRLLRTLSYYRRGIGAVRGLHPEVVHCNDYNTMWIGVVAKLLTGCALIYDSHELWADRNGRTEPRWWLLACEALFLRVADRRLATSPGHAAAIARRHRVAAPLVIRNVAERPASLEGSGAAPPDGPPSAERTLVYVGAVTGSRGLEEAIEALPEAPGVALRILGPGGEPYRRSLAGLAARHGVEGRVRLERPVPPQEVVAEIAGAWAGLALIQPSCLSYALSLPNKLFEYVAAGLPILAADVPTIREFVERNGVGLVVPPADRGAIARAMLEIVEPAQNRDLRRAVLATSARLTWEGEAEQLKQVYREAAAR